MNETEEQELLEKMGIQHSAVAAALIGLKTELSSEYEIDTDAHGTIWLNNLVTSEKLVIRFHKVDE